MPVSQSKATAKSQSRNASGLTDDSAQSESDRRANRGPKSHQPPRPLGTFGLSAADEERVQALLAMPLPADPDLVSIAPGWACRHARVLSRALFLYCERELRTSASGEGFTPPECELTQLHDIEAKLAHLGDDPERALTFSEAETCEGQQGQQRWDEADNGAPSYLAEFKAQRADAQRLEELRERSAQLFAISPGAPTQDESESTRLAALLHAVREQAEARTSTIS